MLVRMVPKIDLCGQIIFSKKNPVRCQTSRVFCDWTRSKDDCSDQALAKCFGNGLGLGADVKLAVNGA